MEMELRYGVGIPVGGEVSMQPFSTFFFLFQGTKAVKEGTMVGCQSSFAAPAPIDFHGNLKLQRVRPNLSNKPPLSVSG